jgi:hypothetical protein
MSKTRLIQACGAVALSAVVGGFSSNADAALTIDLRLANGEKSVPDAQAGQKIMADVWATVTGTSTDLANSYGLSSVNGSIVSNGPVLINIAGKQGDVAAYKGGVKTTALAPFAKSGEQPGMERDLDGDGDIDLGSPNQNDATGFFNVRADPQEYFGGSPAGIAAPGGNGVAWKIGRVELTVAPGTEAGTSSVIWTPRRNAAGAIAPEAGLWYDDEVTLSAKDGSTGTIVSGAPLTVTVVPEPGVIGTLAIGAIGLLARRRK